MRLTCSDDSLRISNRRLAFPALVLNVVAYLWARVILNPDI